MPKVENGQIYEKKTLGYLCYSFLMPVKGISYKLGKKLQR